MPTGFPARYEALRRLGAGGGGEVWEVRDRHTQERYALKMLAGTASEPEMAALVREVVALSGLEGLGVPRVFRFGRLPENGQPYMVRELVEGRSLDELIREAPGSAGLLALAEAAEQLTLVHRAGFFHGDVKPANILVPTRGTTTLVDLGLAAPWRDTGTPASGLTLRYAAPELLQGRPLTVRAEVYALGAALHELVEHHAGSLAPGAAGLAEVIRRATATDPETRYPSADEFAAALRGAAGLGNPPDDVDPTRVWPIVGIEATASRLMRRVSELAPGQVLGVVGQPGSGRSALLRRLAWSLGVEGWRLAWVDQSMEARTDAIRAELAAHADLRGLLVLVDDIDGLSSDALEGLRAAREGGASIVAVSEEESHLLADNPEVFDVPPLPEFVAVEQLRRAIPSLTERVAKRVVEAAQGLPGELKRCIGLLAQNPVASEDDVARLLVGDDLAPDTLAGGSPLDRALSFLARGRYVHAQRELARVVDADPLVLAVARSRLHLGFGDGREALTELERTAEEAGQRAGTPEVAAWTVWKGRAHMALGEYDTAFELLSSLHDVGGSLGAEALAFEGLALSHIDDSDGAQRALQRAVDTARELGDARVMGLALASLGLVLQRANQAERAQEAYEQALTCAQNAGDAGTLGTVQLNLAVLLKVRGDIAQAVAHFEAAVDMGRRSGRRATVRHALMNLANSDLYIGRLGRAQANIEELERQQPGLPAAAQAQLLGLRAELLARLGQVEEAVASYRACAEAFEKLGSAVDGAEARLEGVLVAAAAPQPDLDSLSREVARGKAQLGASPAHGALVMLATARLAELANDAALARSSLDAGLKVARETGQRDWVWRLLAACGDFEQRSGQVLSARRDRIDAMTVLEEIAVCLPRDLREVFWNDPRRRALRALVETALGSAATQIAFAPQVREVLPGQGSISALTSTRLEQSLARILEVNRELLGELDLEKFCAKVIEYAVEMVQAERGCVILPDSQGALKVYTSRTRLGDSEHNQFSRSIAERVIQTREPIVSLSARDDDRMQGFASVHQMLLQSVACVPIVARYQEPLGAIYVETRHRPGAGFERELPTLRAFADQVALAMETTRLVRENQSRAEELARANTELLTAQSSLRELLGARTERLRVTRERLRAAQDTLFSHFGYQGMVGTSETMRRCYALIERVAATDVSVLITGESGTGKEMAARAIHRASARAQQRFLGVNCAALPEELLESELFGHVRGAFTGAERDKKGLLREVQGGTLLLDEIGEMSHKMQAGLLRVLQERKVRPLGGAQEEAVDCRLIFATHRQLETLVREGRFREDLYYRIHVLPLDLPPLRARLDDLPLLVDHFLGIFAARYKRERKTLTRAALKLLGSCPWPGNVRQLEHVLLNAWILCDAAEIDTDDIELPSQTSATMLAVPGGSALAPAPPESSAVARQNERRRILQALESCSWNRAKAAALAGIPRRTFYRRLREYDIQ